MFKIYSILLFVAIALFAVYDFHAGNTFFFGTYVFPVLFLLIGLLATVIGLIASILSIRARAFLKYALVFCLGFLCELIVVDRVSSYQAKQSIVIGQEIVDAIEKSFSKDGKYKSTLEEYVPDYLDDIPPTKIGFSGTDFQYYRFGENRGIGFELYFMVRYGGIQKYSSDRGSWILTD